MFFYISKILSFLSQPISWIFILLLFAVFSKNAKRKQKLLITTLVLYFILGNSCLVNIINGQWETPPINDKNMKHYKVGIVLGGLSYYDTQLKRIHFQRSSDRVFQALDLYYQGKIDKIFISGGAAYISKPYETEAVFIREYLLKIGVPDSVIIIESASKNTFENAVNTKEKLKSVGLYSSNENYLLITSGYHMPRALACFKKQQLNVEPYSVDGSAGEQKIQLDDLFIPNFAAFQSWNTLIHEWIGYITYYITGKI